MSIQAAFLDSSRNAFKLYLRTRQGASQESYSRAKELLASKVGMHPMIIEQTGRDEVDRQSLLRSISVFRPPEVSPQSNNIDCI